ncbi:lactonase family protein [Actinomadura atramentaria]|uniref:lactonase family protein n=1 Tax=Actinomadura atramentaria TaxID=1990 RepID=UPI0003824F92|nr:beta-propeller fold lactonase family protein [Actinomadura atramentaria]
MDAEWLWAGTYTGDRGDGNGVYLLRRRGDGALEDPVLVAGADDPSFLAVHPRRETLYAVGENDPGTVSAYAEETDGLLLTGTRELPAEPCHLAVAPDGSALLVACYAGGAVAAVPLAEDGSFAGEPSVVHVRGGGPDADRQAGPHPHAVAWAPDGTVLAADLGADLIRTFRYSGGELWPVTEIPVPAGYGPRHLAIHPSGRVLVVCELAPRLLVLTPGPSYAELAVSAESPATAGDPGPGALGAGIAVGAGGAHVYTTTRGPDVVTVHRVPPDRGALEPVTDVPTGGAWPRDLHVDGPWLHVANERGGGVTTFHLGPDGVPVPRGTAAPVPTPVCVIGVPGFT